MAVKQPEEEVSSGKGKVEGEQEQSLEQDGGQGDEDAGGADVEVGNETQPGVIALQCTVSVARQRRRVMGITMKRATIKSCMPYQELHDLLLCRGRLGNSFPGSFHQILKVTKRRMAMRASSWQGAHTWA